MMPGAPTLSNPPRFDAATIRQDAGGRWREILSHLGIDVPATPKQHGPCPVCGGKDRFRLDDLDGKGTWFCNQCTPKAGDGFTLVQNVKRCDFPEALALVAGALGLSPMNGTPSRTVNKTYEYTDQHGQLLFQVVRYRPKDFRQRRPDGQGGWIWNLKDLEPVLYRLPDVMGAPSVLIVEGEKDVETAYQLGLPDGWAATCNPMGAGKWRDSYSDALLGTHAVILPDADDPGEKHGEQVAHSLTGKAASVSMLTLPEGCKDLSEWADGHTTDDFTALLRQARPWQDKSSSNATPAFTNGHTSPAPGTLKPPAVVTVIPLDEVRLPELSLDTFPDSLGRMVEAVASATETPVELPALMGLATVAASCQRVFEAEMEPGYIEPLCLWAIAALQSGNRKTSVHSAMTAPLKKKERALCELAKAKRMEVESERRTLEARIKSLRTRLADSEDFEDSEHIRREITQLETTLPAVPTLPSLWAQDVTPEKLGTMMADNGERLAILSDEGGFFDIITGRYSSGIPNLDTCLQGHSCSPVKVNRGGRDEVYMQRPTLTIGLSPQPSVLRDLSNKSLLRDRGFLARVIFALPTSLLGFRTLQSQPIPSVIETAYHRMVEALLAFQPPTNEDGQEAAYRLKPSQEAHREWKEFALTVERDMRPGAQYEHMTDWAGKLPGAAVRVAGLFHCIQHAHSQPHVTPISLETMQRALGVLAVLSQHALAVFDLMGADPALDGARRVWRWVEQGKRQTLTARECFEGLRGRFHKMANLDPAFAVLCERGYLLPDEDLKTGPGRPTRPYTVNPSLTKGWT